MMIKMKRYMKDKINDVIDFELRLRKEEDFWGWEIDDAYIEGVRKSFEDSKFDNAISFLAYVDDKVVGRIDASLICSRFDGSVKAYLDWICVVKSARHLGVAQGLLAELRTYLREQYQVDTLIALMASNEEAQRFYRAVEKAEIRDEGIWMDC